MSHLHEMRVTSRLASQTSHVGTALYIYYVHELLRIYSLFLFYRHLAQPLQSEPWWRFLRASRYAHQSKHIRETD